jgi:hypothetical protein
MVKCILILSLAAPSAIGQTATGSIQGTILDAKTLKPVSAALVIASRAGAPPFTKNTKSGGDGVFQIQGLTTGNYSLCVQASGDVENFAPAHEVGIRHRAVVGVVIAMAVKVPGLLTRLINFAIRCRTGEPDLANTIVVA